MEETALHYLAETSSDILGNPERETTIHEIIRLLLSYGAKVDAKDAFGDTPLIHAANMRHYSIVRLLLEHGADIFSENKSRVCALSSASWGGNAENIQELLAWGAGRNQKQLTGEFHATFWDDQECNAILLIRAGVKIGLQEAVLLIQLKQLYNDCGWVEPADLPDGRLKLDMLLSEGNFTSKEIKAALTTARKYGFRNLVQELKQIAIEHSRSV